MASLHSLPVEIAGYIVDMLALERGALWSLSAVCTRLHDIANPYLYRRFDGFRQPRKMGMVRSFLRTIIQRKLGHVVRQLDLRPWGTVRLLMEHGTNTAPSEEDFRLFIRAAKQTGLISHTIQTESLHPRNIKMEERHRALDALRREISFDRLWLACLQAGIEDAEVILLLSMLPNVKEIKTWGMFSQRFTWDHILNRTSGLRNLTRLRIATSDVPLKHLFNWQELIFPVQIDEIIPILQLPKFSSLIVRDITKTPDNFAPQLLKPLPSLSSLKPNSLKLTKLALLRPSLWHKNLSSLLSACHSPFLTSFTYIADYSFLDGAGPNLLFIMEHLTPHASTLEHLEISIGDQNDVSWSLADFPHLHTVVISVARTTLTGFHGPEKFINALPPMLETYHGDFTDSDALAVLQALEKVCNTRVPNLRRLSIDTEWWPDDRWIVEDAAYPDLLQSFNDRGVELLVDERYQSEEIFEDVYEDVYGNVDEDADEGEDEQ